MDTRTKGELLADYDIANKFIRGPITESTSRPSFLIRSQHYLWPTIITKSLPLSNERGELQYFMHIRQCIEDVLINEKTKLCVDHAPMYLKQFFE